MNRTVLWTLVAIIAGVGILFMVKDNSVELKAEDIAAPTNDPAAQVTKEEAAPIVKEAAPEAGGKYDAFAQCLKNKGAVFFGAAWCPHCQAQKAEFGMSVKFLSYVECAVDGGNGQAEACAKEKITVYPTWKFGDGSLQPGALSMEALAQKTGCVLP